MSRLSLGFKVALVVAVPSLMFLLYRFLKEDDDDYPYLEKGQTATTQITRIEVKIPKENVGSVIGRGGSNIRDITDKSGARIDIGSKEAQDSDDFRMAYIRGSKESAQLAESLILQNISNSTKHTIEMKVKRGCIGRIIGKNGETIRNIQKTSGAKIKVDSQTSDHTDSDANVLVTGSSQQISVAKTLIEDKVKEYDVFQAKIAVSSANRQQRPATSANHNSPATSLVSEKVVKQERWDIDESSVGLTPERQFIEVYVSAYDDPGHFWVQVVASQSLKLDDLVYSMSSHYGNRDHESPQTMQSNQYHVGDMLAAPFDYDESWYRARVEKVSDDSLTLFYVDYGDRGCVAPDNVYDLDDEYQHLPFQALECQLADVKPVGDSWTEEAGDVFAELTHCAKWNIIMARTVRYQSRPNGVPIPCLRLVDTTGPEDVDINEEMVRRGHAVMETEVDETGISLKDIEPHMSSSSDTLKDHDQEKYNPEHETAVNDCGS